MEPTVCLLAYLCQAVQRLHALYVARQCLQAEGYERWHLHGRIWRGRDVSRALNSRQHVSANVHTSATRSIFSGSPWVQQDGARAIALPTADAAVTARSSSVRCDGRPADCKCTERGGAACQCSRNPGQSSAGKTTIRCMPCRCHMVQQADDFSSHANTSHRASPEPSAPPVEPSVAHPLTRSPHLAIGAVAALHCTDPNLVPPTAAPTVTNYLSTAPCSPPLPAAAPGGCQQDEAGRGRAGGV